MSAVANAARGARPERGRTRGAALCTLLAVTAFAAPAGAEMSAEELAKLAQNPVGNMVSVPFQYNGNLNYGPNKDTQSILNIQPVYPISVNSDWNIITRTILPVIWQPSLTDDSTTSGIGDLQFDAANWQIRAQAQFMFPK